MILGIDPSLRSCGVVVIDYGKNILKQEVFGYGLSSKNDGDRIKRYLEIARGIVLIGKEFDVDFIGIEGLGFKQKGNSLGNQVFLAELMGVIKSQIYLSLKKIPIIVAPAKWKSTVLNNGRADKKLIKDFFIKENYKLNKQDLYDALGVAFCILEIKNRSVEELCCARNE